MSIQSPTKREIRTIFCYPVMKGKSPVMIFNEVKTIYSDKVMNCTNVHKWYCEFKNGRTSLHDDQRNKRPSVVTDKLEGKFDNAVPDDHRLTLDKLSAMFPEIYRSLVYETIKETLGYRKLSVRWVPKQLTEQHRLNRMQSSKEVLEHYELGRQRFLHSIVTGDET